MAEAPDQITEQMEGQRQKLARDVNALEDRVRGVVEQRGEHYLDMAALAALGLAFCGGFLIALLAGSRG